MRWGRRREPHQPAQEFCLRHVREAGSRLQNLLASHGEGPDDLEPGGLLWRYRLSWRLWR
eukprot:1347152-Pyramimonas_sp.AAC.1